MSTSRCTHRADGSRLSHPPKRAPRWRGPMRYPSLDGSGTSRPDCGSRRGRRPASSLSVKATTSGAGATSSSLTVRPGSTRAKREAVVHDWHKSLLHEAVPELIRKWEPKLGVQVAGYFLQRMKTKWGGCNHRARHIRLNTELVKKPKDLLEYVVVHEMLHLIEPAHSEQFVNLLSKHYPGWREARAELNELPLGAEAWKT